MADSASASRTAIVPLRSCSTARKADLIEYRRGSGIAVDSTSGLVFLAWEGVQHAYGREDILIRIASQLEQANPWAHRKPGM